MTKIRQLNALRRIKQKPNEIVQEFNKKCMTSSEEAYPRSGYGAENELIQKQLVDMFCDGLGHDYLKMKLSRAEPNTPEQAVEICMREQNM